MLEGDAAESDPVGTALPPSAFPEVDAGESVEAAGADEELAEGSSAPVGWLLLSLPLLEDGGLGTGSEGGDAEDGIEGELSEGGDGEELEPFAPVFLSPLLPFPPLGGEGAEEVTGAGSAAEGLERVAKRHYLVVTNWMKSYHFLVLKGFLDFLTNRKIRWLNFR